MLLRSRDKNEVVEKYMETFHLIYSVTLSTQNTGKMK